MIINSENNIKLPNGLTAFDLRHNRNNLCAWNQKNPMLLETPIRFGGDCPKTKLDSHP